MGRGFEPRWGHVSTVDGFLLILALGLAALSVAAWFDWLSARRAHRAFDDLPPVRDSPPTPLPAVHDPTTFTITASLADPALATRTDPLVMVLTEARVLACPEGVGSVREVVPLLEGAIRDQQPLVLVAPTFASEVIELLVVNITRGVLRGGALVTSAGDCFTIIERLDGHAVTRADLQSGAVAVSSYGQAAAVVAGEDSAQFTPAHEA